MSETPSSKSKQVPAVYALSRPSRCHGCDQKLLSGDIVKLKGDREDSAAFCKTCAGLSDFELLPGGNAQATRLAGKYSTLHYRVLKWSELWKTYERQGILVERQAIDRLEKELGITVRK